MSVLRVQGVILPPNKHTYISLQAIFGIGRTRAKAICKKSGIPMDKKIVDLEDQETRELQRCVEEYTVEGYLRSKILMAIKRLKEIRCYRGFRHIQGLPMKARTKTNARTRKGRKGKTAKKKDKER